MLSLPPIALDLEHGEYELVLPCPTLECIRLLAWYHGRRSAGDLERQLLENPSLLIHAAISYYQDRHEIPQSSELLTNWFADQLLEFLASIEFGLSNRESGNQVESDSRFRMHCDRPSSFLKPLRKYLLCLNPGNGRKQGRLRSVRKFLVKATGIPQSLARRLIARLLPAVLKTAEPGGKQVDCASEPSPEVVLLRWLDPGFHHRDFQGLLQLHQAFISLRSNFDDQVQQEKLASLQQLAYGASHEINNPLANIASRAQTLLGTEANLDRRFKLGTIYEQAMRSHEMISDLMLFANPPKLHLVATDLREFLSRFIHQVESRLDLQAVRKKIPMSLTKKNEKLFESNGAMAKDASIRPPIHLIVRIPTSRVQFRCDPIQLSVALMALVQNSVESILGSGGSTIDLRVSCQHGQMGFEVTDDGQGVPRSLERHLFDPFFSGREAGRGLGFGLSKAWRIAQLHGGVLSFDKDYGSGARFVLRIPG